MPVDSKRNPVVKDRASSVGRPRDREPRNGLGDDGQRPRAWKRGSPEPEPGDQPDHPPRQAPVKQQLFHKVPRRKVRVPRRGCPPRMAGLANSSTGRMDWMRARAVTNMAGMGTRSSMFDYCKEPHTAPRQGADAP